jgi:hypothetical protein
MRRKNLNLDESEFNIINKQIIKYETRKRLFKNEYFTTKII